MVPHNRALGDAEARAMRRDAYVLDGARRRVVTAAIHEVCTFRGWTLLACNVRSNHVHAVVQAAVRPEKVIGDFKAIASRRLTEALVEPRDRIRWTRHGSTRYLWTPESIEVAIRYVVDEQGVKLQAYENTGEIDL
jgi:REP element-mobilizing transposase RayT